MPRAPSKPRSKPASTPARRAPTLATTAVLLLAAGIATACNTWRPKAPELAIDNPDHHRLFVDGRERFDDEPLPFRYYGVTRWDLLPRVQQEHGLPVFDQLPASGAVAIEAPASPWLFPLDFPLEVIDRLLHGRRDQHVTARAIARPADEPTGVAIPRDELSRMSARGRAARASR